MFVFAAKVDPLKYSLNDPQLAENAHRALVASKTNMPNRTECKPDYMIPRIVVHPLVSRNALLGSTSIEMNERQHTTGAKLVVCERCYYDTVRKRNLLALHTQEPVA